MMGANPEKQRSVIISGLAALIPFGPLRGARLLTRSFVKLSFLVALCLLLSACGGDQTPPSQQQTTSLLAKRALVTNLFTGEIHIVDAQLDVVSLFRTSAGNQPSFMVEAADKRITIVFNALDNSMSVIDNATERETGRINLTAFTESIALSSNAQRAYAALRNPGLVAVIDLTNGNLSVVAVPTVRRLVLSPDGSRLLAFSDDSNSLTVIDTSTNAPTVVAGFDRPTWGVFSSDGSVAYILNCGPQCGGTTASIRALDMATNTPGASVVVSAATIAVRDGSRLLVAGTAAGGGRLDVVDIPALTVSSSGTVISDGFHHVMALTSNGKLFIGARTCSNVVEGCLSIVNTSGLSVAMNPPRGEVTGLQPIDGRDVVYVAEGGELRIYSTTTDSLTATQINFVGNIADVKLID